MTDTATGSVRRGPSTTGGAPVALRVNDGLPGPWLVATVDRGAHFTDDAEVADWQPLD